MADAAPGPKAEDQPFSATGFLRLAARRLPAEPPAGVFDPAFTPRRGDEPLPAAAQADTAGLFRPAAVLVPVVARPEQATILLTRRAEGLRDHGGQIAFPGGKIDAADASPLAAALREAQEEIGLEARSITPLGYLDAYQTSTGFRVLPVIALIDPGYALALNANEVASVFEAPLGFLMNADHHQRHARMWRGHLRHYHAMPYGDHYIWGVTAGILRALYERLYAE